MSACTIGYLMLWMPAGLLVLVWIGYLFRMSYREAGWRGVRGLILALIVVLCITGYAIVAIRLTTGCH